MLHNREREERKTALSLPTISLISRIAQGQKPLHFPTKVTTHLSPISHVAYREPNKL